MKIETGYLYHIKNDFFDLVKDEGLMINHESGKTRPTYFTIRENDILWFVPVSCRVNKYESIIKQKIKKYGSCKSIMIVDIASKKNAVLIQNAFPILEKYIDHIHMENGAPVRIADNSKKEILDNFKYMLALKKEGINLFFTDIDRIKEIMLKELALNY